MKSIFMSLGRRPGNERTPRERAPKQKRDRFGLGTLGLAGFEGSDADRTALDLYIHRDGDDEAAGATA